MAVTLLIESIVAARFSGAVFTDANVGLLAPESQVARALLLSLRRHTDWKVRVVR